MNTLENLDRIGYYKYETLNTEFSYMCHPYPITEEIINYLKKINYIKLEFEKDNIKLINGKFVALI